MNTMQKLLDDTRAIIVPITYISFEYKDLQIRYVYFETDRRKFRENVNRNDMNCKTLHFKFLDEDMFATRLIYRKYEIGTFSVLSKKLDARSLCPPLVTSGDLLPT